MTSTHPTLSEREYALTVARKAHGGDRLSLISRVMARLRSRGLDCANSSDGGDPRVTVFHGEHRFEIMFDRRTMRWEHA